MWYHHEKTLQQEFEEQRRIDQFAKSKLRTEQGLKSILTSQNKLVHIIKGMEALLRTELSYDEDYYQAIVHEVEFKDQNHVIKCPNCSRVIGRSKTKCMYCEQSVAIDDIFHFVNITPVSFLTNETAPMKVTAEKKVEYALEMVLEMEKRVEPLISIAETLWGILKDRFGFSDEQLVARLGEEDTQSFKTSVCPSCGRTVGNSRVLCIYCGAPVKG